MHIRRFFLAVGASVLGLCLTVSGTQADTILVFGQDGTQENFIATNDLAKTGATGATTLSASDIPVTITGIDAALTTPIAAFFTLDATSITNAFIDGTGHVVQDFNGTFSITSGMGDTGTNYLSGAFNTSAGGNGATLLGAGSSLTFSASSTVISNGIPSFSSDVITKLDIPRGMSLGFTNVIPDAHLISVNGTDTVAAFGSNVAGNFSAFPVPEPSSMVLVGLGGVGLLGFARNRKKKLASVETATS